MAGRYIPGSQFASMFTFNHRTLTILLAVYGFLASVLPVWLLLSPRDYLSSIMKISVIGLLAIGLIIVAPEIKMPAFTEFGKGRRTNHSGKIIPVPFYNDCMWSNFRFSFSCKFRYNSQNDNEGS